MLEYCRMEEKEELKKKNVYAKEIVSIKTVCGMKWEEDQICQPNRLQLMEMKKDD